MYRSGCYSSNVGCEVELYEGQILSGEADEAWGGEYHFDEG